MKRTDLEFSYPEKLVATARVPKSRVMLVDVESDPRELAGGPAELLDLIDKRDLLVVNDTQVLSRRLYSESGLEILFLAPRSDGDWEVLCPSSRWKRGEVQRLPEGVSLELISRGRPQIVRAFRSSSLASSSSSSLSSDSSSGNASPTGSVLDERYFQKHGELPLPPYIQKARGERRNRSMDSTQYQTAWAERPGSLAAPTASLHFSAADLERLADRGVRVEKITLHVGLGTFLPVTAENLSEHVMHAEYAEISARTWQAIQETKARGGSVWVIGTTVTRALEAAAHGRLFKESIGAHGTGVAGGTGGAEGIGGADGTGGVDGTGGAGGFFGSTDIFIVPGFEFQVVDVLLTNFHQPQSTLLALVAAFAGLERVKSCYQWAIEREFALFSYGDLSVWRRPTQRQELEQRQETGQQLAKGQT